MWGLSLWGRRGSGQAKSSGRGMPLGLETAAPAASVQSDWASLPLPLLSTIFFGVTQCHEYELQQTVEAWQSLALVCKHWLAAAHATKVGLTLTKASHLGPEARAWLSSVPLEALLLPRDAGAGGAEGLLLEDEGFRSLSARTLRSVVDAGPSVFHSLHAFANLIQVAIFVEEGVGGALEVVPFSIFQHLASLHCLSVAGHFHPEIEQLPASLAHLAINIHPADAVLHLELPPGLALELLDVKAHMVVADWGTVCCSANDVHLAAELMLLTTRLDVPAPSEDDGEGGVIAPHAPSPEAPPLPDQQERGEDALYRAFCAAIQGGRARNCHVAFVRMALRADGDEFLAVPVDVEAFLELLVGQLLGRWDVCPSIASVEDWIGDQPSPEPCFLLDMARQQEGEPRSFTITMPLGDREEQVLLEGPVARISWCDDPRVPSILGSAVFQEKSGKTLAELFHVPLTEGLDLSNFSALRTLVGSVATSPLSTVAFPSGLQSLCLEAGQGAADAEGAANPAAAISFSSAELRLPAATALREVGLYGFGRHDFSCLPASVTNLRVVNPNLGQQQSAVVGSEASGYRWPCSWRTGPDEASSTSSTSYFSACSDSDSEAGECMDSAAAPAGHHAAHAHAHAHGGPSKIEPDSAHHCNDPLCSIHSGKRSIYISISEPGTITVDLSALLRSRCQMLTLNGPDSPNSHLCLLHDDTFAEFEQAFATSDLHALEINCFAASVSFAPSGTGRRSIANRLFKGAKALPLGEAMQRFVCSSSSQHGDVEWEVKSWKGGTAHDGILEGSKGYALIRKP